MFGEGGVAVDCEKTQFFLNTLYMHAQALLKFKSQRANIISDGYTEIHSSIRKGGQWTKCSVEVASRLKNKRNEGREEKRRRRDRREGRERKKKGRRRY